MLGRPGFAALITALAIIATGVVAAPPAQAVAVPITTTSYYMNTVSTTTLYNMGCAQGTADLNRPGTQSSIVILDFGALSLQSGTYYSSLWSAADAPLSSVVKAVENYGRGYWACTESDIWSTTTVALGTNNSGGTVTRAAGQALAGAVNQVGAYFRDVIGQVAVAGGNDIEMGYSDPGPARAWVDGYASVADYYYYDFGSAEGCSWVQISGSECGTTAHPSWNAVDVWYVAWGSPDAFPVPEIYLQNGRNADQWKWLGVYSKQTQNRFMTFLGPMTQHGACVQRGCNGTDNTPSAGYTQLYNALNSDTRTKQTPSYLTDVKWH